VIGVDVDGTITCSTCGFSSKDATQFLPAKDTDGLAVCRACSNKYRCALVCAICEQPKRRARVPIRVKISGLITKKIICHECAMIVLELKSSFDLLTAEVKKWDEEGKYHG
jgi:hypothetical protein